MQEKIYIQIYDTGYSMCASCGKMHNAGSLRTSAEIIRYDESIPMFGMFTQLKLIVIKIIIKRQQFSPGFERRCHTAVIKWKGCKQICISQQDPVKKG